MEFRKIFKYSKMEMFKNDKFWLNAIHIKDNDVLTEGFYTFYHTYELKGGLLNVAGIILIQVKHEETEFFIPIDDNTIIGEIQVLVAKYIDLYPNKFIMTGADKKDKIFTAKNRLNGGGKLIPEHDIDNVFQISTQAMEMLAEKINEMIVKDFLEGNQYGITEMKQTESWHYVELFKKTIHYESPYLLQLQKEGFIEI
jgi:hypothetical protein